MDPVWVAVIVLSLVLTAGALSVHLIEWRLYISARSERDTARADLVVVTKDRDGWRRVAERALFIAEIGKRVTARATLTAQAATGMDEADP